ncbi:XkdF-like putative serine protease domain-containing protein [Natrinema zhouii]|uniref:Phage-like element PBSX protein XkdF domain-containing protein n=1 Tax=Natrinema zhouii TaxID=1710539 RepID=A0A7D6GJS7_9EURY|nr:XkdF-like putative serine protease domain-containing protein [Natrinema zhouii]QLK25420.1 XkdF-like putative serine protease domain-containing protein [Natrinema zhouii]
MTEQRDEQLTKRVDFVAKDDDEQIATGIVMVPDKVDLQRDFVREDTIRGFADQFGDFMEVGQADGGLMHAVWPSDWMELERNEVLDEAAEIGGKEAPAGAWIQSWKFNDDDLWQLVKDDILGAFSIGAIDVQWGGPYEQDELEDVDVPNEIDEDELVWELAAGIIREVSSVDIPAVPDAQVLETKADAEKRLADHLGNRDGFIEEALERNSDWSEDDAEQLWETLNSAIDVEGSGEPGEKTDSVLARAGKAALSVLTGSDDDTPTSAKTSEAPDRDRDRGSNKEGRTLSTANQHSLYAAIDTSLDVLQDAGVDHGMTRFTDREDTTFDLTEHTAREWSDPDDEEDDVDEDSAGTDGPPFESAAGGETPDDNTTMSDENGGEEKSLAEQNAEQISDLTAAIDDLADSMSDEGSEKDEETGEEKSLAEQNAEKLSEVTDRIDAISKQTGTDTQQIGKSESEESEKGGGFTLDPRKARGN